MSKVQDMAANAKRLKDDSTFQDVLREVKDAQTAIFLNVRSSQEEREEAHVIIRALGKIEGAITSRIGDGKFEQGRDQHRGTD